NSSESHSKAARRRTAGPLLSCVLSRRAPPAGDAPPPDLAGRGDAAARGIDRHLLAATILVHRRDEHVALLMDLLDVAVALRRQPVEGGGRMVSVVVAATAGRPHAARAARGLGAGRRFVGALAGGRVRHAARHVALAHAARARGAGARRPIAAAGRSTAIAAVGDDAAGAGHVVVHGAGGGRAAAAVAVGGGGRRIRGRGVGIRAAAGDVGRLITLEARLAGTVGCAGGGHALAFLLRGRARLGGAAAHPAGRRILGKLDARG